MTFSATTSLFFQFLTKMDVKTDDETDDRQLACQILSHTEMFPVSETQKDTSNTDHSAGMQSSSTFAAKANGRLGRPKKSFETRSAES